MAEDRSEELGMPVRAHLEHDSLWKRSYIYIAGVIAVAVAALVLVKLTSAEADIASEPVAHVVAAAMFAAALFSIIWVPDLVVYGALQILGKRYGHPKASFASAAVAGVLALTLYADLTIVLFAAFFRDAPVMAALAAAGLVFAGFLFTAVAGVLALTLYALGRLRAKRAERDGKE